MSRILIAWELGGNYGHLTRCLAIAEALRERGHVVLFAVSNTRTAAEVLSKAGFAFVQAPKAPQVQGRSLTPANFSEILLSVGFGDPSTLMGMLQAWRGLFRLFRPDVVLADHAPTALLSARANQCPAIAIGNGFAVPAAVSPQPSIRPWKDISEQRLLDADNAVNQCIAKVWRVLSPALGPAPRMTDLYVNALLDTFAEFDHFGERKGANYIGPIVAGNAREQAHWKNIHPKKIIAYLDQRMRGFAEAMQALQQTEAEIIAVVPRFPTGKLAELSAPHMRVFDRLVSLEQLLPDANLVVNYGGTAIMANSLMAGVQLLLLPMHVEQYLAVQRVNELGASISLNADRSTGAITQEVDRLLNATIYTENALAFAKKYESFDSREAVMRVMKFVEFSVGTAREVAA